MGSITHVLFDMDGLLLEDPYTEVNNTILARFGEVYTWDVKSKMSGSKETDAAAFFVNHYKLPLSPEEYLKERKQILKTIYPFCKPLPGVIRLVTHLKQHNIPICIATSSTREALMMKASNNRDLFDQFGEFIICSDDAGIKNGKPAPDLFFAAAKALGVDTDNSERENSDCLVFEDSFLGVKAGLAAKMKVVWIPNENLALDPETVTKCAKLLRSMTDFDPADGRKWGLNVYPRGHDSRNPTDGERSKIRVTTGHTRSVDVIIDVQSPRSETDEFLDPLLAFDDYNLNPAVHRLDQELSNADLGLYEILHESAKF
ncbi:hypothetical protein HK100_002227 [Physocladia obscura]|uniref:Uncharacterized protein n=1 Tax=Physocladia obscura TaxID=109957 RepID=A0AAD5T811_9FUNG|nr:hypothetical protein HK100_002227 [Physocladia obscura]